jgi:hypothetical protein
MRQRFEKYFYAFYGIMTSCGQDDWVLCRNAPLCTQSGARLCIETKVTKVDAIAHEAQPSARQPSIGVMSNSASGVDDNNVCPGTEKTFRSDRQVSKPVVALAGHVSRSNAPDDGWPAPGSPDQAGCNIRARQVRVDDVGIDIADGLLQRLPESEKVPPMAFLKSDDRNTVSRRLSLQRPVIRVENHQPNLMPARLQTTCGFQQLPFGATDGQGPDEKGDA